MTKLDCSAIFLVKYCKTIKYLSLHFILVYWFHWCVGSTPLLIWKTGIKNMTVAFNPGKRPNHIIILQDLTNNKLLASKALLTQNTEFC